MKKMFLVIGMIALENTTISMDKENAKDFYKKEEKKRGRDCNIFNLGLCLMQRKSKSRSITSEKKSPEKISPKALHNSVYFLSELQRKLQSKVK